MNPRDVYEFLATLLSDFWVHPSLVQDISDVISKSGSEVKFYTLFLTRLKYLHAQGILAINHEEFEALSNTNGLYSMHLAGKGFNIRILYAFSPEKSPILLSAFHKRAGKKKTDYTQYIPIARQRLLEELEAHKHER